MNFNKIIFLLLFCFTIFGKINAQFNCDTNVANNIVDLSYSQFAVYTDTIIIPPFGTGECCNQAPNINCTSFDITLNPNATSVQFKIIGPAGNTTVYYMNCNSTYALNDNICVVGNGGQIYSVCTDLMSNYVIEITSVGPPIPLANLILRENCDALITAEGLNQNSISWNSISPGLSGAYNNLLDCDTCPSITLTPTIGLPPIITYTLCGVAPTTTCGGGGNYCDTFTVSIHGC